MSGLIDDTALESEENSGSELLEGNGRVGDVEQPADEAVAAASGGNSGLDNDSLENEVSVLYI